MESMSENIYKVHESFCAEVCRGRFPREQVTKIAILKKV